MKKKLLVLACIVQLFSFTGKSFSQGMIIETNSGEQIIEKLAGLETLSFPNPFMVVSRDDNSTHSYNLLSVSKIYFDPTIGVSVGNDLSNEFTVYPNPTSELLYIGNYSPETYSYKIFSLDGKEKGAAESGTPGEAIDVGHLENGMYILMIDGKAVKFIKQ